MYYQVRGKYNTISTAIIWGDTSVARPANDYSSCWVCWTRVCKTTWTILELCEPVEPDERASWASNASFLTVHQRHDACNVALELHLELTIAAKHSQHLWTNCESRRRHTTTLVHTPEHRRLARSVFLYFQLFRQALSWIVWCIHLCLDWFLHSNTLSRLCMFKVVDLANCNNYVFRKTRLSGIDAIPCRCRWYNRQKSNSIYGGSGGLPTVYVRGRVFAHITGTCHFKCTINSVGCSMRNATRIKPIH